jgi:DNA-directed RNA polymerase I subunit RPA2
LSKRGDLCVHLCFSSPWQHNEFGGYFLVNGIERCVRLLQIPRRNHPTAIQRSNYKNRGPTYTDLGVAIRCCRFCGDQTSVTNTIHYLTTGGATIKFVAKKQEFLIPIILVIRALSGPQSSSANSHAPPGSDGRIGITDEELFKRIVQGDETNTFLRARAELLLQEARARFGHLNTPDECLAYVGERFRSLSQRADSTPNIEVGHFMIRRYLLIHLPAYKDKLECLLFMLRKLYAFAAGDCGVDNADSMQNQEILLPGHLMTSFVKEKFEEMLQALRLGLIREMKLDFARSPSKFSDSKFWSKHVDRHGSLSAGGIGKKVQHFLSTGNIISTTGLDLMQVSGFTIVAERLNFLRYCAHFRSVHRGQFFLEMKTTAVRKLLPDQWGFLCPVHTPDGGPCGLLSHLALKCSVLASAAETNGKEMVNLSDLLVSLGVAPVGAGGEVGDGRILSTHSHLPVCLDGKVIGSAPAKRCRTIASHLRTLKVAAIPTVPPTLEVAMIPPGNSGGPYPGLYLFLGAARLVRPVLHRASGRTEYIGPMEQPFMDIACLEIDIREGITTHQELDPTNMLSLVASLTPFSDYNQSPRNMYQCQMGKQTMGTPVHSLPYRSDNKLYKLQNPQAPVVQTKRHGEFKMDEYPNGTNAVVAVLSYTGFDMEDAMIINKGAYERGFGHASVYKTLQVDLAEEAKRAGVSTKNGESSRMRFSNKIDHTGSVRYKNLGLDGLPEVGTFVEKGDPLYCVVDELNGKDTVVRHKEKERAYIQSVRSLGCEGGKVGENKASVTLRFNRNPVIGDKFSSRHGQKGVLSIVWPQEDMPFSESGITPDVIINPHAFPSRMTIGMLIESMAGKSGALHGMFQEGTPFSFHESGDKLAIDYFGEQLQKAGYNYYGSEPLYSGVSGCLMQADLYIGIVYYQRLRHMVSDKYQVRATGPVNQLTRQPIKGRKKGGGIRLGEMERDSLLSHGTAFLLHDRLLNCSDKHVAYACSRCGDLLSPTTERNTVLSTGQGSMDAVQRARLRLYCRNPKCKEAAAREGVNDEAVEPIVLPYVYRYLVNELAAMNVKLTLSIK